MDYTFDADIVSDLHKDAYGFRPSESWWANWYSASDAGRQAIWDDLLVALDAEIQEEEQRQKASIDKFEALVAINLQAGAADRATALRWIMDVSEAGGDWEYLCYLKGLPYQYFQKAA
jgi:hypothetical protein